MKTKQEEIIKTINQLGTTGYIFTSLFVITLLGVTIFAISQPWQGGINFLVQIMVIGWLIRATLRISNIMIKSWKIKQNKNTYTNENKTR